MNDANFMLIWGIIMIIVGIGGVISPAGVKGDIQGYDRKLGNLGCSSFVALRGGLDARGLDVAKDNADDS